MMEQSAGPGWGSVMPDDSPKRSSNTMILVVGSEMFGFAMVGVLIDFALGTVQNVPWATLILAPLGLVIGFYHLVRLAKLK